MYSLKAPQNYSPSADRVVWYDQNVGGRLHGPGEGALLRNDVQLVLRV